MKGYLLAGFSMLALIMIIISSGAYTTLSIERDVSLQLVDDTSGIVSLYPTTMNPKYFYDSDNNGAFELHILDVAQGEKVEIQSIFKIENDLNETIFVKIFDDGNYPGNVTFTSNLSNLENGGITIPVGNVITVDVFIDAIDVISDESLISGIDIVVSNVEGVPFITLTRTAEILIEEYESPEGYDPNDHTMPENVEFMRGVAYDALSNGIKIRTWGDYRYTDMGLDPKIWNKTINGYTYKYNRKKLTGSEKIRTIQLSPKTGTIKVKALDNTIYTIYKNQSIYLDVYALKWYAKIKGHYEEVIIWEYY